jgi:hypothetical protein
MDIPLVGQLPPAEQAHRSGGHGGGHAKTHAPVPQPPAARGDTAHISDAARLAAQRALKEEELAEARRRAGKDGSGRQARRGPYQDAAGQQAADPNPQGDS